MSNTLIAAYDTFAQAREARAEVLAQGLSQDQVHLQPETEGGHVDHHDADGGSGIGNFFRNLFGMKDDQPAHAAGLYSEAVRRGAYTVVVSADNDDDTEAASAALVHHHPIDIEERTTDWRSQGWQEGAFGGAAGGIGGAAMSAGIPAALHAQGAMQGGAGNLQSSMPGNQQYTAPLGGGNAAQAGGVTEARIPIVEEELKVGKREVERGSVSVIKQLTKAPVTEQLNLREEHIAIERKAVDQPASAADFGAFQERTLELHEMAEEAVASKSARVVEEVIIGRTSGTHQETISDTLRHTGVEIEQLTAAATPGTSTGAMANSTATDIASATGGAVPSGMQGDDAAYRSHWQSHHGSGSTPYEKFVAAYQ